MGKIKTKYPLEIQLDFMLFLQTSELIRDSYSCVLQSGNLEYYHLQEAFQTFLTANNINYEAYMFFQPIHAEREELVQTDWTLALPQLEQHHRYIIVKVKSHTQHLKDLFYEQMEDLVTRVNRIEQKLEDQPSHRDQNLLQIKIASPPSVPMLHHASSMAPSAYMDKDLDIGVLFSEPIFDEKRQKQANMPVDFRSQLQRLQSALNNSYKPEITIECQIATRQHLKHLITYKKPTILHIICHGSKEGELQFEDDSKFSIGALCSIPTDKIRQILKGKKECMPELVFINSCHSEIIGRVFYEAGAKYCIMIDSQDKIDDEAAQIFSENFYRNIFRGEKVGSAFTEAQDNVKIKHNSSGCCCRHTSRQVHKPGCLWLKLCQTMGEQQAHRIYHIPTPKCTCQLRNLNQHELTCEWAQFSLFQINCDFRIKDNGTERFPKKKSELPKYLPMDQKKPKLLICCCFNFEGGSLQNKENHIPHSESNKFKMLPEDTENTTAIYELQKNIAFRTQVISMTAPELIEHHQRVSNSSVMGRQQELYTFMKNIQNNQYNTFFIYGHPGVGKTCFAIKAATYLLQRQVFHIYYFIDLFGIKDRDMFRNKFNQVTKLDYPFNQSIIKEIAGRKIIIILDNVDQFFMSSIDQFQEELDTLKKEFVHIKIILTCKEKNITCLENSSFYADNRCRRRQLNPLDQNTAAKALYAKIRHYLDIGISYLDIREIVGIKAELCIPKMIQNFSHSFSNSKGKVKLNDLRKKIEELGNGDLAFNKLIQENLNILKTKSKESYDMLIFISQFSQGIDKNDFAILSSYDRTDNKEGLDSVIIDIPIDRYWKKRLAVLFQQPQLPQNYKIDSQGQTSDTQGINLDRRITTVHHQKLEVPGAIVISDQTFQNDSYFLEELSRNRFVVRRFIRDFIWNKDRSVQNFYMKHIFVAYTSVMLDIYLGFLVTQKYIHESLIEYTDISQAGIFKYKDNNYSQFSLTESIRYVEDYNSRFEKMLKQQQALRQKIKNSDPSVFIFNHKLDFLHIYGYDWSKIYEYLYQTRKKEASVLINYLQRLIILIPTAMKVADLEESLRKYAIRQSIQLLAKIRKYSKPAHNLFLTLKLKLMKASEEVDKSDQSLLPNTEFQKDFHMTDLQGIDSHILKSIQDQFNSEIEVLQMYQEYSRTKDLSKSTENAHKIGERVSETVRKLEEWNSRGFRQGIDCQILDAKRKLILGLIFHKVVEVSIKYPTNTRLQQFNNYQNLTSFVKKCTQAANVFQIHNMTKLTLRGKLLALSISWDQLKNRVKQNQFSRELQRQRGLLRECEDIYEDKRNNLIGLTIFDAILKRIKKEMKDRMWQQSANNIAILTAVPLSNKNTPILQNVVRKRQKYRKNLEQIFRHAKIDISVKFEILTVERLDEQTKRKSNILLLNTTFRIKDGTIYIVCENNDLTESYIEINEEFVRKFKLTNTKLLLLMGQNATEAFTRLEKLLPTSPSMISVDTGSTAQFDDFDDLNFQNVFDSNSIQGLRKTIEHLNKTDSDKIQFCQSFIKSLINPKNYQNINYVLQDLRHQFKDMLQDFKIKKRQISTDVIIRIKQGTFKDLSPGFRKAHNVDLDFQVKNSSIPCVYRKWKEINQIFREFSSKKQTKYVQICGSNGVGKTAFIQEIGRLCIERGLFENGVYIINGKKVGEKFQSDFEAYINNMAQTSTMFTLQSFNRYADSNFLLIIDDFHTIKPRSNGRYNLFMTKLLQKKANVIFVTHETFNMREIVPNVKMIKLQKLIDTELNIFAYNLFKPEQEQAIQQYQNSKKTHLLTCAQISRIYEKHLTRSYTNYNNAYFKNLDDQNLRKMTSNYM